MIGRPFLYGTTREFLIRFGLNDLGDLPKVEDMAQALGFEAPAILIERPVTDEMLPLEEELVEGHGEGIEGREGHEQKGAKVHEGTKGTKADGWPGQVRALRFSEL